MNKLLASLAFFLVSPICLCSQARLAYWMELPENNNGKQIIRFDFSDGSRETVWNSNIDSNIWPRALAFSIEEDVVFIGAMSFEHSWDPALFVYSNPIGSYQLVHFPMFDWPTWFEGPLFVLRSGIVSYWNLNAGTFRYDHATREIKKVALSRGNSQNNGDKPFGEIIFIDEPQNTIYWAEQFYYTGRVRLTTTDMAGEAISVLVDNLASYHPPLGVTDSLGIALDLDARHAYWLDYRDSTFNRINLDGRDRTTLATIPDFEIPSGNVCCTISFPGNVEIDVVNQHFYWLEDTRLRRINLDGTGMIDVTTGLTNPTELVLSFSNVSTSTGPEIPDQTEIRALDVFPNPTTGSFTLSTSLSQAQKVQIEVFDMLGRRVGDPGLTTLTGPGKLTETIDISRQPAGVYVVRLGSQGGSRTAVVVKQ